MPHASDEGLRDGKVLTENIDGITFKNKEYNFRFILSDRKKLVDEAFKEFLALKNWEGTITANTQGGLHTEAKIVRGDHEALKYRGNALKRHKIWFQKETDFYYAYKYTGWQHAVLPATFSVDPKKHPGMWKLITEMEKRCPQNHWIMTCYENGHDYIGPHSDKTKTWAADSSFHVVKWGCPRRFVVTLKDESSTVLFDKILPEGTEIIVDASANEATRHAVPPMVGDIGISGSIVGRLIQTKIAFEEAQLNLAKAKRAKENRRLVKKRKRMSKNFK